jgi:hypothetical protein
MRYVSRRPLVYLLPLVHCFACITIKVADLTSGVHYLILVDFPFSLLLVMLGWPRDNFLFWFTTLGTLWWYFLSFVAQQMFSVYAGNRGAN